MKKSLLCLALLALLSPATGFAQADEKDVTIPLSTMVLFTSGVGYFQHDGTVDGNAKMELTFSADQVNDLLKSLVLRDLDGGTISSVTYSSRDPITRTLKSFSIDLTSNPTLSGILAQTRGESIEVTMASGTKVTGAIISVEQRETAAGTQGSINADYLNLNTPAGVSSLALADIQGIRFLRQAVQDDLAQALQTLSSSHGVEKKKLVLHFVGTGKRRIRIGYILEAPVWKTSYRLVLADNGQHLLQGWALVENTSDTDWKTVALSLVSGRPITFTMDLYQPLYVQRPEVQLELYQSLVPKTNALAMDQAAPEETDSAAAAAPAPAPMAQAPSAAKSAAPGVRGAAQGLGGAYDFSEDTAAPGTTVASAGVKAAASGGQVGELFQYTIDKPVTLPRQQSAMLPILNQAVTGERYSLYNPSTDPRYPLNAVKLKNTSTLHLMQGPITVFDAGTYAGDAQISDLAPGAEQLVTYALDLDTEVAPSAGASPVSLVSVKISKGVFQYTNKNQRETDYAIVNRGIKARTVLIEHPLSSDWTLTAPAQPLEKTRDSYRFAVPVAAGKSVSLAVIETRLVSQSVSLSTMGSDQVSYYLSNAAVTAAVKTALQKLVALQSRVSDTVAQRSTKEARVSEIGTDQSRIRQNMGQLDKTSDLYKQYVKTLSDEEAELATLRSDIAKLRDQETTQRKDVSTFIQGVDAG